MPEKNLKIEVVPEPVPDRDRNMSGEASPGPSHVIDYDIEDSEAVLKILRKFEAAHHNKDGNLTFANFKPVALELSNNILDDNDVREIYDIFEIAESFDYHKFAEQLGKTMPVVEYGSNAQLLFLDFTGIVLEDKDHVFSTMKREDQQQQQLYDWIENIMPKLSEYEEIKFELSIANDEIQKLQESLEIEKKKRDLQQQHYDSEIQELMAKNEKLRGLSERSEELSIPAVSPIVEESNATLRKDIATFQLRSEDLEKKNEALVSDISDLQKDLQTLRLDYDHERGLRQRLEKTLKDTRDQHEKRKGTLQGEINNLRHQNQQLEHELSKMHLKFQFALPGAIADSENLILTENDTTPNSPEARPQTSYPKLKNVLSYEEVDNSDPSSPVAAGRRDIHTMFLNPSNHFKGPTGLTRLESTSTLQLSEDLDDSSAVALSQELANQTLLAQLGSKAHLTRQLWQLHRRKLSKMTGAKRNNLSLRKLQRTQSMLTRTQASSFAWSDMSGNSSPRHISKRLSSGSLPINVGARNEDIVRAINLLRNDVAKYELHVMETTNDMERIKQEPLLPEVLESLNLKLAEISSQQQKTDSGGTQVDKMQDEIIRFLSDEQNEMMQKITQMLAESKEKDETLKKTLIRLEEAQKQIIQQNEKIENMNNVDDMQNELMQWISEEQKALKQYIEEQKESKEAEKRVPPAVDAKLLSELTAKLDEISAKTDETLKLQEKADSKGTSVDSMQDEIIRFLSEEQKEILEKITEMQKHSQEKDDQLKETLERLEQAQSQILEQNEKIENMSNVDEMQNELMQWISDEQKALKQYIDEKKDTEKAESGAMQPLDANLLNELSSKLDQISAKTEETLKIQTKADMTGTSVDKMQDEIIAFLSNEQKEMMDKINQMQKESQVKDDQLKETLKRLEQAQNQIMEQNEKMENMNNVDEMQNELMQWISEEQKALKQYIEEKKESEKAENGVKQNQPALDANLLNELSAKLDQISEKTDASLKLQSKADSAGTETDKMQDEILKFLSTEQKEMMDNIIQMQKDSQEKDLVLNQTLKRLEDAQNQILEQSEKIESMSNVGQMQNDLMQWISEEQKTLRQFIDDRKESNEKKNQSELEPEILQRLEEKIDATLKRQEETELKLGEKLEASMVQSERSANRNMGESDDPDIFKRLESKLDASLKKQVVVDSTGTEVDRMQDEVIKFLSDEQKEILDKVKQIEAESRANGLDPKFVERLEQKLDNISKIQESANKDGTNVDKMQNELIQFMQSEQKKLLDQMGKMQKEAEEKDERMKETLSRLENTQQELLTQKEQMESMQKTDELQNELMKWMGEEQDQLLKKIDAMRNVGGADGGGSNLLEQIFNEQRVILEKMENIESKEADDRLDKLLERLDAAGMEMSDRRPRYSSLGGVDDSQSDLLKLSEDQKSILEKMQSLDELNETESTELLQRMCDEQKRILAKVENLQKEAEDRSMIESEQETDLIRQIQEEQKEMLVKLDAIQKQQVSSPEEFARASKRRNSEADVLKRMRTEQKVMLEKIDELQVISKDLTISLTAPPVGENRESPRTSLIDPRLSGSWNGAQSNPETSPKPKQGKNPEDLIKKYLQKERKSRREEQAKFYNSLQSKHETHMDEYKGMFDDLKEKVEKRVTLYEKLLQSRRDSEQALKKQIARFQQENEDLKESLNGDKTKSKRYSPARVAELEKTVKSVTGENELLQSQLKALKKSLKHAQNDLSIATQEKNEGETEILRLRKKVNALSDELNQELESRKKMSDELKDLRENFNEKVGEAQEEIRQKLEEQKKSHDKIRQRMDKELEAVYGKNELLISQLQRGEEMWPKLEALLKGNEELKLKEEERRKELMELQNKMQAEIDAIRAEKRAVEDEMQNKVMDAKEAQSKLERELANARDDLADLRQKELLLLQEVENLKLDHVAHAQDKIKNLQRQNETLEDTKEELERHVRKKDREIAAMKDALDELEDQLRARRSVRDEVRGLQKQNDILESAKEELAKHVKKKDKELDVMRNALEQLEEQLKSHRLENQSKRHGSDQQERIIQDLQKRLQKADRDQARMMQDMQQATQKADREQIGKLESALRHYQNENNAIRQKDLQLAERFQQARKHAEKAEKERDMATRQLEETKREMLKQAQLVEAIKQQLRESVRPAQNVQAMERRLAQTVQELQMEKMKNRQPQQNAQAMERRLAQTVQELQMEKMKNRQLREDKQKYYGRPAPQQEIDLLKQISNQLRAQLKDREAQIQEMFQSYEQEKEKWNKEKQNLVQERGGSLLRNHQANHAKKELENKVIGLEKQVRDKQREIARLEDDLEEAEQKEKKKTERPQKGKYQANVAKRVLEKKVQGLENQLRDKANEITRLEKELEDVEKTRPVNWDKIPLKVLRVLDNFDSEFDASILCVTCKSRYIQWKAKKVENLIRKASRRDSASETSSQNRRLENIPPPSNVRRKSTPGNPPRKFLPLPNKQATESPSISSSISPTQRQTRPSPQTKEKKSLPSIANKSKTSDRFRAILGNRRKSTSEKKRKSVSEPVEQVTSPISPLSSIPSRPGTTSKKAPPPVIEIGFKWNERRRVPYTRPMPS